MAKNYDATSIELLTGLEPVRKRPGMYTNTANPNHLLQEVIDNSVDEAIAGHADSIEVFLHEDGSASVVDNGRGMPVDVHPEHGLSGVELILTRLHAGAKFNDEHYQFAGGLHGVGVSVVNALSSRLEVEICRGGGRYRMAFAEGGPVTALEQVGRAGRGERGTRVHFWPDLEYFDAPEFALKPLVHLLRSKAVLCPGLRVVLNNEHTDTSDQWQYPEGLAHYLSDSLNGAETLLQSPFIGDTQNGMQALQWAVQWPQEQTDCLNESYVNLIPTPQGGTHVNAMRSGLLEAVREFCELRNLLPRNLRLSAEDIGGQCAFVLSLRMQDPQFSGQTKEKLSSRECASFVSSMVSDTFSLWLNQHHEEAGLLATWVIGRARTRSQAARQVERKRALRNGPALPGKLADCTSQKLEETELFLVEGDSAGGSAKQARNRNTQAVMPLRGKIRNTWEVDTTMLFESEEVRNISIAIGVTPGEDNLEGLRYGKICILADADSDGAHIATLLTALFMRHFRALVGAGRLYVAMPPLYRIDAGDEVYYALNDEECDRITARLSGGKKKRAKASVQRFKGLGEMNPGQLRETTMAVETRRLVQLSLPQDPSEERLLDMLLAKNAAGLRRDWLQSKGNLARGL